MATLWPRAAALLVLFAANSAVAGPLTATEAWVRATPPGARTAAVYLTITSTGASDRLLGGRTAAAGTLEVHRHVVEAGLARMVRLTALELPADAAVHLEPGGAHLMLIDIVAPLVAGNEIVLTLDFAAAGTLEVTAPVVDARTPPGRASANH